MNGPDHGEGTVVAVAADTVRRGDVINVGGLHLTVRDLTAMPGGAKRLLFTTGETFTMHLHTVLNATCMTPPPQRVRRIPPRHASALGSPPRRTP